MHFIQGSNRNQYVLMNKLDGLVEEKHYVRLINAFVGYFMENNLGVFLSKGAKDVGRKACHPGCLLKLYIYSCLNGVSSSRKIEKECKRNIEVIWLMEHLIPDHKTISDFRRVNKEGVETAFLTLANMLKERGYINGKTLSLDGTKIKANAGSSIDMESISKKLENLEEQLSNYLEQLESTDQLDDDFENKEEEKKRLEEEIEKLKEELGQLQEYKKELEEKGIKRMSPAGPDCRIMKSRQGLHYCYNAQTVVDPENQMIASTEVLSEENDRWQLTPMVEKA